MAKQSRIVKQSMSRSRGPQKISHLIADLMTRRGYARQQQDSAYRDAWQQVTGSVISRVTQPGQLRNGVLDVVVENSTIMQEMTFQRSDIIRELNQRLGSQITDLKFRIGRVS